MSGLVRLLPFALLGGVDVGFVVVQARRATLASSLVDGSGPASSLSLAAQDAWYGAFAPLAVVVGVVVLAVAGAQLWKGRASHRIAAVVFSALALSAIAVGLWLGGPTQTPREIELGAWIAAAGGTFGVVAAVLLGAAQRRPGVS